MSEREYYLETKDGTSWPDPTMIGEMALRLRSANRHVTTRERIVISSVLSAYQELCLRTDLTRKPTEIRKALRTGLGRRRSGNNVLVQP